MKRLSLLFISVAATIAAAFGQTHYVPHVWVGVHGGATLSEMSFSPSVRQAMTAGATAGVAFRYAEERHVGIQCELNITQRGWKEDFEDAPFNYSRHLTYVSMPIMTHIFFGGRRLSCTINLGPEIGYLLSDKITADFDYTNPAEVAAFPSKRMTEQLAMDVKNRFDYGITAGIGAQWNVTPRHAVYLEGRYYYGLGNIFPSSKRDTFSASRCNSIAITLGYMFRIK